MWIIFLNLSPVCLTIKVWEYSHLSHVNYFEPEVAKVFSKNLEKCIDTLNQVWDMENYACLEFALLWFQFERNKLEKLMQTRDEEFKEKLIESILKRDESVLLTTIFFPETYFFLKKIFENI